MTPLTSLRTVLDYVKSKFIGKEEIIELLGICLIAQENALLYGPPGTAKSAIVRMLASTIHDGHNFEYLLTRFTEPNEIFGPFDIPSLKNGVLKTNTEGMLPEASLVFLDEIFNANSAILNSLLMALNERMFKRGNETKKLPALLFVGASNNLPEDEALNALFDRFLVRIHCDYVAPDLLSSVLAAGRQLAKEADTIPPTIATSEIQDLQLSCRNVDLSAILPTYVQLVFSLRNAGINISDRRAVKLQQLIAASALMSHRNHAIISDLWVLKHIWDAQDQIELLSGMIQTVIGKEATPEAHPMAFEHAHLDVESLMKDLQELRQLITESGNDFEAKNIMKDKLRYLQSRIAWINNDIQKAHLETTIQTLWQTLLQEQTSTSS